MPKIIIASGPVIVEEFRLLLVKEGITDAWKLPGGKIEDCDTTFIETARRESKEEIDVELEILDQIPFILHLDKETARISADALLVHYRAKRSGEIKPGPDIRAHAWIPIRELENLGNEGKLMPNIIPALKHFGYL